MNAKTVLTAAVICLSFGAAHADESALALGKSTYDALCAVCHGDDARGGGEVGQLFEVAPADLTKISERAGGRFPFADVYHVIILGMEAPGHGPSEMPIWGDHFQADALVDRGVNRSDAIYMAAGRAMSLALYLETIQK